MSGTSLVQREPETGPRPFLTRFGLPLSLHRRSRIVAFVRVDNVLLVATDRGNLLCLEGGFDVEPSEIIDLVLPTLLDFHHSRGAPPPPLAWPRSLSLLRMLHVDAFLSKFQVGSCEIRSLDVCAHSPHHIGVIVHHHAPNPQPTSAHSVSSSASSSTLLIIDCKIRQPNEPVALLFCIDTDELRHIGLITHQCWLGCTLFCGSTTGTILRFQQTAPSVLFRNTTLLNTQAVLARGQQTIVPASNSHTDRLFVQHEVCKLDSAIVSMTARPDQQSMIVSTLIRACVLSNIVAKDSSPCNIVVLGTRLRKEPFGACNDPHDAALVIAGRPGNRLWRANASQGNVLSTVIIDPCATLPSVLLGSWICPASLLASWTELSSVEENQKANSIPCTTLLSATNLLLMFSPGSRNLSFVDVQRAQVTERIQFSAPVYDVQSLGDSHLVLVLEGCSASQSDSDSTGSPSCSLQMSAIYLSNPLHIVQSLLKRSDPSISGFDDQLLLLLRLVIHHQIYDKSVLTQIRALRNAYLSETAIVDPVTARCFDSVDHEFSRLLVEAESYENLTKVEALHNELPYALSRTSPEQQVGLLSGQADSSPFEISTTRFSDSSFSHPLADLAFQEADCIDMLPPEEPTSISSRSRRRIAQVDNQQAALVDKRVSRTKPKQVKSYVVTNVENDYRSNNVHLVVSNEPEESVLIQSPIMQEETSFISEHVPVVEEEPISKLFRATAPDVLCNNISDDFKKFHLEDDGAEVRRWHSLCQFHQAPWLLPVINSLIFHSVLLHGVSSAVSLIGLVEERVFTFSSDDVATCELVIQLCDDVDSVCRPPSAVDNDPLLSSEVSSEWLHLALLTLSNICEDESVLSNSLWKPLCSMYWIRAQIWLTQLNSDTEVELLRWIHQHRSALECYSSHFYSATCRHSWRMGMLHLHQSFPKNTSFALGALLPSLLLQKPKFASLDKLAVDVDLPIWWIAECLGWNVSLIDELLELPLHHVIAHAALNSSTGSSALQLLHLLHQRPLANVYNKKLFALLCLVLDRHPDHSVLHCSDCLHTGQFFRNLLDSVYQSQEEHAHRQLCTWFNTVLQQFHAWQGVSVHSDLRMTWCEVLRYGTNSLTTKLTSVAAKSWESAFLPATGSKTSLFHFGNESDLCSFDNSIISHNRKLALSVAACTGVEELLHSLIETTKSSRSILPEDFLPISYYTALLRLSMIEMQVDIEANAVIEAIDSELWHHPVSTSRQLVTTRAV